MTRPALIIGLGGTGQWVLTYLKKDLKESNNGQMPPNVRLLAFDTMPQASVEAGSATASTAKETKVVEVGSVRLTTRSEFFHIGGDMYPLGEDLTQGDPDARARLNHIGGWFSASHWMHTLPRASWVLSAGAGQLRQFGRLGLFKDLSDRNQSEIWNRIDVAARSLEGNLNGQRLEIIVVGSFAGGTGSGMFIDVGLLLRKRTRAINSLIRGYFILPRVFDQNPDDDMKARSFAAWRELNRFMTVSPNFPMPALIYNPDDAQLQIHRINEKAYDACYLVDGRQGNRRIDAEPERVVFPAIADAISALLDDTAGNAYTEWVVANLAPEYAAKPGVPLYSAVGAHSFKVPVYYAQQEFAHKLTANMLDALLCPICDDALNPKRITRVSDVSHQDPLRTGFDDRFALFSLDFAYEGNSEEATLFTKRMADIQQNRGAENLDLVGQYAAGALYLRTGRGRSWLGDFMSFGNRADVRELTQKIDATASLRLTDAVKASKDLGEEPQQGPARFAREIPKFYSTNYGGRDASGRDYGGLFGTALEQAGHLQVDIFSRNTQLWLLKTLMGDDAENVLVAKSGRIGYAFSLLNGVVQELSNFLAFLATVEEQRRGQVQPRLKAEELRNRRLAEMQRKVNAKMMLFWTSPQAYAAQDDYLQAEQLLMNVRMDELLHRAVENTAKQMQLIARNMRDELERWIQMLATGDPASGVVALAQTLEQSQTEIQNTAEADDQITAQTTVKNSDYQQDNTELTRLMRAVNWRIDIAAGNIRLSLQIASSDGAPISLERPADQGRSDLRESVTQRNLTAVLDLTRRRYSQLPDETRIAQKLAAQYDFDASRFVAEALGDKATPFFARLQTRPGGAAKWTKLIRISMDSRRLEPRTVKFVENMQQEMRRIYGVALDVRDQNRLVEVVGSADLHKCSVVFTDDLYDVKLFDAWEDCKAAYLRNPKYPPHLNHNFPAETTAAQLEMELANRRRIQYRVFHPWVVMLLEYREHFEQFLLCKALGWIKANNNDTLDWWEFKLPNDTRRALLLTEETQGRSSLFQVMHSYILVGRDRSVRADRRVDYQAVNRALLEAERLLGDRGWLDLLRSQIETQEDERLVVPWMLSVIADLDDDQQIGRRNDDEPANYQEAYTDLAEVSALLIERRIDKKEQQIRSRQTA